LNKVDLITIARPGKGIVLKGIEPPPLDEEEFEEDLE
jgi:hypothetical protein